MTRPCFLVIDRENAGNISTRKLVIETAKLNVITAYSGAEALATLERFPRVDAIVMDTGDMDLPCPELVQQLKQRQPAVPIVAIAGARPGTCEGVDHVLDSFDPPRLLQFLRELVPVAGKISADEERALRQERA